MDSYFGLGDCSPRREDLPAHVYAAVECVIDDRLVDRVGLYLADHQGYALDLYVERMSEYDVELGSGDCEAGTPGDSSSRTVDPLSDFRSGCFLNENHHANVRLTCFPNLSGDLVPSPGLYVGVLGSTDNLAELYNWAWGGASWRHYVTAFQRLPDEEVRDPQPAICARDWFAPFPDDRSIDAALARCPSAAEVALVEAEFTMTFVDDPSAPDLVCHLEYGSADLTRMQKRAYQAVLAMRWIVFDEPLPWTDESLFDWFAGAATGIRFEDVENSYCCYNPGEIVIGVATYYQHEAGWAWSQGPCEACGLYTLPGLFAHEARHAEGYGHTGTCAIGADETFAEMGAWALHYLWFHWLAEHANSPFMRPPGDLPADRYEQVATTMSRAYPQSFCQGDIPAEWAPSTPTLTPLLTPSPSPTPSP